MPADQVERRVIVQRGPHWWLAWLSDSPDHAHRGRSAAEAVGRLTIHLAGTVCALPPVMEASGMTLWLDCQPLTQLQLAAHRRDIARWRTDPHYTPTATRAA